MKAVWYRRQGPAREVLELGELPAPRPTRGEALVRLRASGVNPADCNRRAGRGHAMDAPLVIPHSDGAGEVEAVGDGVDPVLLGRRVWLYNGQRGRAFGTAAEYIAIDVDLMSELPTAVSFEEGACLGIPCMTAWCALFEDGPIDGRSVLVTGGAGAVGHYAVQLAHWAGARVFATVSGPAKAEEARRAGADFVFDYRDPDHVARLLEASGARGFERIIEVDFGGNLASTLRLCADNAVIAAYASRGRERPEIPFYDLLLRNIRVHALYLASLPVALRRRAQQGIGEWLRTGQPIHRVAGPFRLEQTPGAHEAVERGDKRGTVVVRIP